MKIKLGKQNLTAEEAARLCGGYVVPEEKKNTVFSYVCTDSREADADTLFCAICGEITDGHKYINSSDCRCSLCEKVPDTVEKVYIVVDDTVKALSKLAYGYCRFDSYKTVAVTGSVGKTTTKEIIASVLKYGSADKSYKTAGNYNSVIGLPLSMLEIPKTCDYAVLEMGMGGLTEIETMSQAATPDIAIITIIGSAHLELLGSRENIRKAKLEITKGLKPDGVLLINGDDEMLNGYDTGVKTLSIGIKNENADYVATEIIENCESTAFTVKCHGKAIRAVLPTYGLHNVYAALFAYAVADLLGIPDDIAVLGLEQFEKPRMRQNIYDVAGITIIEDCYNASPESMRAALDVEKKMSENGNRRQVAFLGNMLELGTDAAKFHRDIGEYAEKSGVSLLFTYGDLAENIAKGAASVPSHIIKDTDDKKLAADMLLNELRKGDILLVKASRALAAEKIIDIIKESLGKETI